MAVYLMDIEIKMMIAIWGPVIWPWIPSVIIYLIGHKAIERREHYWTISLIGGYCIMFLAFAASSLLARIAGDTLGVMNEHISNLSLALTYGAPMCLCIYAAFASSKQNVQGKI